MKGVSMEVKHLDKEEKGQMVVIEQSCAVSLFTEGAGVDDLLEDIKKKASSLVPDVTTAKGRKEIASVAYAVAKTKTYLDGLGKDLVDKYKEVPKRIDANRKIIRDALDALKEEVRAPLTQHEAEEAARVASLKERIAAFEDAKQATAELPSAELEHYLQQIESIAIDDSWEEMTAQAGVAKDAALLHLRTVIEKAKEREAQAAELERLRQEAAAREQADRERRIAEEAQQAEARRQEQDRLDAERRESEAKAREEQARRDAEAAEFACQQAESRRIAEAELAEKRRKEAEVNAARQAEEAAARAAEQERKRIEDEQRQKAEDDARRAADSEHRASINGAILAAFIELGVDEEKAKLLIIQIASKKIANISINY